MKVICAGLSRTGTLSLAEALRQLGYNVFHFPEHIRHHQSEWLDIYTGGKTPDFKTMYTADGCSPDAVADIPPAYFFEELLTAFPQAKVILTVRDEDSWFKSFSKHISKEPELKVVYEKHFGEEGAVMMMKMIHIHHRVIYGIETPCEFIQKKKFRQHNERVLQKVPDKQLLVLPVENADWTPLCTFLDVPIPGVAYPTANKGEDMMKNMEEELKKLIPSP